MDKFINAIIALCIAVGVSGGMLAAFSANVNQDIQNAVANQGKPVGAVASPDIASPYVAWGGYPIFHSQQNVRTATTTPCALQSPSATSSLTFAGIDLKVSSSTVTEWDIANGGTNPAATTTAIGTPTFVPITGLTIIASTTPTAGATIFGPNTWLVFGARLGFTTGDTAGTGFVPSGKCEAEWTVIPGF